jgi:hypothetical protein
VPHRPDTLLDEAPHPAGLQHVTVPDLWQQQAVLALRAGKDVVVHAPTGSGKTLIFELWSNQGRNRQQAIYTVPTRALANDKYAEWRARGWNVGIATGDLAENLDAPILVATLETQKNRLIRGDGPALLVVDEYQMLGDDDRGLNYELALALAPAGTRLLLLSGSVANPHHIVQWFRRLGREAVLVQHQIRPVPLEEVRADELSWRLPNEVRTYWARLCARALAENLGPILLFAPRRQHAEELAAELARQLPVPHPLQLSDAQKRLVGDNLARLLKTRVVYHHSGLSYAVRAGVIEPLAKAGQLRVVVATMGLAAGINFSLRSVAVTAAAYRREGREIPLRPDELLQMFGRAGRRGLDDTGYVLVNANELRIRDGHPAQLSRSRMVDWPALLGLMAAAADQGKSPFVEAVRVQERLFTTKPIFLGVEESLKHPNTPCGLQTDAERARHVRKRVRELLNSRGDWEAYPHWEDRPLADVRATRRPTDKSAPPNPSAPAQESAVTAPALVPALTVPEALEQVGQGGLTVMEDSSEGPVFGRSLILAEKLAGDRFVLAKPIRRLINWHGRDMTAAVFRDDVLPKVSQALAAQKLPVVRFVEHAQNVAALVSLAAQTVKVPVDRHGVPLWRPRERDILPPGCADCSLIDTCRQLPTGTGTALLWRRLGLVEPDGAPTRRGRIVSFFSGSDGLAISVALEDAGYPLEELVYDLANLDAGFRFCGQEDRWAGRLSHTCRRAFGNQNVEGYLETGVPPRYGSGAETVVRSIHVDPYSKARFTSQFLGDGDIDRVIIEWRSLLRQIAHAPRLDFPRWQAFQDLARATLNEVESPTDKDLPPLEHHQTRRLDHRLIFRKH